MKMTLAQHVDFGLKLKRFRELLLRDHISCVGKRNSRENRAVQKALKAVQHLKDVMDGVVCSDFPDCSYAIWIYYGDSKRHGKLNKLWPAEMGKTVEDV